MTALGAARDAGRSRSARSGRAGDTRDAVAHGIPAIGRVIVAAAIMGTVVAALILSTDRIPKEFPRWLDQALPDITIEPRHDRPPPSREIADASSCIS